MIELEAIATVSMGYHPRGKIESDPGGDMAILQPRNIRGGEIVEAPARLSSDDHPKLHDHRLRVDDVLLSNKGGRFAGYWVRTLTEPTVASTSLFVIRMKTKDVLPGYLHWYLEQPTVSNRLEQLASRGTVISLAKSALNKLEIPVPDLEAQHRIIRMADLVSDEKRVLLALVEKRKDFLASYAWEQIRSAP